MRSGVTTSTIDSARPVVGCGVEGRLPDLRKLVQEVRDGRRICRVVHECDQPLARIDHGPERWPCSVRQGLRGRYKGNSYEASSFIDGPKGCGRLIVDVDDENGEHCGEGVKGRCSRLREHGADLH